MLNELTERSPIVQSAPAVIGIDASRAVSARPTGTETYSREIINALLRLESNLRFRLYTRATPPAQLFPSTSNYEVRATPFPRFWTLARLSAEMLLHRPDALFVPAHVLPPIHPPSSFVTVHDLGYLHFPRAHRPRDRYYLDLSTRWNVKGARRVFADSASTRADLVNFYRVPAGKVDVVYPGYDEARFNAKVSDEAVAALKSRYGLGDYVLAVGTVQPRKNYERLARVCASRAFAFELVIAGGRGWGSENFLASLHSRGLQARVRLLDYVPADDLPALYRGARLFVFPSLYEGFGLPILEAQASGTPVVCSNTSSLPEIAGDGAEYFDPLDVETMARAIRLVMTDSARRDELIQKGRANLARFSWQRTAQQIVEIMTRN